MKFNKKKLLMFGIPLLAVVLVSAALIVSYAIYTGMFTVTQSVEVTGDESFSFDGGSYIAGDSFSDCDHSVKNVANVGVPIKFGTTCANSAGPDDGVRNESDIDWATLSEWSNDRCDGITTSIYGVLELTKKDTNTWQSTDENITINYTIVGDTFEFIGVPDGYTLIYYKDEVVGLEGRLANPQPAIIVTSDIGSLPHSDDANIDDLANYCGEPDNYEHCKGAKLWVVPTGDITGTILNWANMADYYYETDLIVYSSDAGNKITLPSNGGGFKYCVQNDLVTNLQPDTYTIITQILPA